MSDRFICDCAELLIGGERLPMPEYHDCDYVKRRNALIPEAVRIANARAPITSAGRAGEWAKAFAATMDELARPLLKGAAPPVPVNSP